MLQVGRKTEITLLAMCVISEYAALAAQINSSHSALFLDLQHQLIKAPIILVIWPPITASLLVIDQPLGNSHNGMLCLSLRW